jgi:hypothetical protein
MKVSKIILDTNPLSLLLVLGLLIPVTSHCAKVVDRLVLELNQTPFTQNQIKNYVLTHITLSDEESVNNLNLSESWTRYLAKFLADMIIDQEASRLGSYEPTTKMLEDATQLIIRKDTLGFHRKMSPDQFSKTLKKVLRIENFKRIKQRQLSLGATTDTEAGWQQSAWYKDLREKAMIRFFKDAYQYIPSHADL